MSCYNRRRFTRSVPRTAAKRGPAQPSARAIAATLVAANPEMNKAIALLLGFATVVTALVGAG
jgi:hypothetical protein